MIYFFHTVEFYVLMLFVAAAVVALCARPSSRGEALTHLIAGVLSGGPASEPELAVRVADDGTVFLIRRGLQDVYVGGSAALAITQIGFSLDIKERVIEGVPDGNPFSEAEFALSFLAPEWYHVRYTDERTGRFAAFSLHVRSGITLVRPLVQ